jgi:hypothetical protein
VVTVLFVHRSITGMNFLRLVMIFSAWRADARLSNQRHTRSLGDVFIHPLQMQ